MNRKEDKFRAWFKNRYGYDLVFEPCKFMFSCGIGEYRPDFLCVETSTYYEVYASVTQYRRMKPKLDAFKEKYPLVKMELVNPDGSPFIPPAKPIKHRTVLSGAMSVPYFPFLVFDEPPPKLSLHQTRMGHLAKYTYDNGRIFTFESELHDHLLAFIKIQEVR